MRSADSDPDAVALAARSLQIRTEVTEPPRIACERVLIVEDEPRLREMLHASITEMGLRPASASSAEAALRLLSKSFFAIAVVDLNLPGIGGLELCQLLREHKSSMQFIILTGYGDLEAAKRAIRLEVIDFLTKPCGMDDLESALSKARLRWLNQWLIAHEAPAPPTAAPTKPVTVAHAEDAPLEVVERQLILAALLRHQGNREAAAAELGISVRKLYYRLQQYQRQRLPSQAQSSAD